MAVEWYCRTTENKEFGPFASADLKKFASEGRITSEMWLRKGNDGPWVPASKVKGLFDEQPRIRIRAVPKPSFSNANNSTNPPTPQKATAGNPSTIFIGFTVIASVLAAAIFAYMLIPPKGRHNLADDDLANRTPNDDAQKHSQKSPADPPNAGSRPQLTLAERKANPQKHVVRHPNGSLKSEHFAYLGDDGKQVKNGRESQWFDDGKDMLEGNWVDGQRDGTWTAWHKNGQKWIEGEYQNGNAIREWSYTGEDGKSIGKRQDGVRVGVWKHWSKDAKTFAVGEYVMGVKNGKWQFYKSLIDNELHDSSPTLDIEFQDGIWNGNLTVYNKTGEPEFHTYYEQGKEIPAKRVIYLPTKDQFGFPKRERVDQKHSLHFMSANVAAPKPDAFEFIPGEAGPFEPINMSYEPYHEYWSNAGQLRAKGEFRLGLNGQKIFHGKYTKWFSNGKEEASITYNDGAKQGPFTEWYDSGQLKREGSYIGDKPVGKWLFWYASGRKKAEFDLDTENAKLWEANGDEASAVDYKQLAKSLFN